MIFKTNPKKDAFYDIEEQNKLEYTSELFVSKKYYRRSKQSSSQRNLAFILVLLSGVLFALAYFGIYFTISEKINNSTYINGIGVYGFILGAFSIFSSCAFFFISFNMSYTDYQKAEYDFYYDYYLHEYTSRNCSQLPINNPNGSNPTLINNPAFKSAESEVAVTKSQEQSTQE